MFHLKHMQIKVIRIFKGWNCEKHFFLIIWHTYIYDMIWCFIYKQKHFMFLLGKKKKKSNNLSTMHLCTVPKEADTSLQNSLMIF